MVESGKTQREIAEHYGYRDKTEVMKLLARELKKQVKWIPKQRGRKPAKTLAEYKYENKPLKMENERRRNFMNTQKGSAATDKVLRHPSSSRGISFVSHVSFFCLSRSVYYGFVRSLGRPKKDAGLAAENHQ